MSEHSADIVIDGAGHGGEDALHAQGADSVLTLS
jgi:hypothetical protein